MPPWPMRGGGVPQGAHVRPAMEPHIIDAQPGKPPKKKAAPSSVLGWMAGKPKAAPKKYVRPDYYPVTPEDHPFPRHKHKSKNTPSRAHYTSYFFSPLPFWKPLHKSVLSHDMSSMVGG